MASGIRIGIESLNHLVARRQIRGHGTRYYLKAHTLISNGTDISYGDEINHFYILNLRFVYRLCQKKLRSQKVNVEYLEDFQGEEVKQYKDIEGKMKQLDTCSIRSIGMMQKYLDYSQKKRCQ